MLYPEVTAAAGNSLTIRSPKELNASGTVELKYVYSNDFISSQNEELTVIGANALKSAGSAAYTTVIGADAMLSGDNHQKICGRGASCMRNGSHLSSVALGYGAPIINSEQCVLLVSQAAIARPARKFIERENHKFHFYRLRFTNCRQ